MVTQSADNKKHRYIHLRQQWLNKTGIYWNIIVFSSGLSYCFQSGSFAYHVEEFEVIHCFR